MRAVDLQSGKIEVVNKHDFVNLSCLVGEWELVVDGEVVQGGQLPLLNTRPGFADNLIIPYSKPRLAPGAECFLNLRFRLREDTLWAKAGHEVAWEQFKLPFTAPEPVVLFPQDMPALEIPKGSGSLVVRGKDFGHRLRAQQRLPVHV